MKKKIFGLVLFLGMLFVSFSTNAIYCCTFTVNCAGGGGYLWLCGDDLDEMLREAVDISEEMCSGTEWESIDYECE